MTTYAPEEMMAVEAARRIDDGTVCFVGIGLPSLAANLARRSHAPNSVLIYESGTIGAKPEALPLSIGDGELAETADSVVSVPELFAYWLQGDALAGRPEHRAVDRVDILRQRHERAVRRPPTRRPVAGIVDLNLRAEVRLVREDDRRPVACQRHW